LNEQLQTHSAERGGPLAGAAVALSGLVLVSGPAQAADAHLGDVTAYDRSGDTYTFGSGVAKLRVEVADTDLLRALVGQYTCTGTTNQQWLVTRSGAQLKLTAKHSGLSLAVDGAGKVVQVTDTGAATQRWTAPAS